MTFTTTGEGGFELITHSGDSLSDITKMQSNMLDIILSGADSEGNYPPLAEGNMLGVGRQLSEEYRARHKAERPITQSTVDLNIRLLVRNDVLEAIHNNPSKPKVRTNLRLGEVGKRLLGLE